MAGFVIPIGTGRQPNWTLAKEHSIWALVKNFRIQAGDDLFFWQAQEGLIAYARATTDSMPVLEDDSLPWPDHAEVGYKWSFNFRLIDEPASPVETQWKLIQEHLGSKDIPNKPALRIDTSRVPVFVEMFGDPSIDGPPDDELAEPDLDPAALARDLRPYAVRAIRQRLGQASFRSALISEHGARCMVTGCDVPAVVEAAHIRPYKGPHTNVVGNGLLLRSDIHTLFDLYLLTILPSGQISLAPPLRTSPFGSLDGTQLASKSSKNVPSASALADHNAKCSWLLQASH